MEKGIKLMHGQTGAFDDCWNVKLQECLRYKTNPSICNHPKFKMISHLNIVKL